MGLEHFAVTMVQTWFHLWLQPFGDTKYSH